VFLNGSISTEGGAVLVENSIYQDCLTPLRNNQTDVNNPTYTGKIMALNSIYSFRNTDGTTNTYTGASTNAPGDSYFGPVQAPVIAFSWNLTNNVLPYTYVMDSPTALKAILTNSATGAGAGVLQWNKTNWLRTSY
jgi:pectate lyase